MANIAQVIKELRAAMPRGKRSPNEVIVLLTKLEAEWETIRESLKNSIIAGSGDLGTYEQLVSEADAFETRMAAYRAAAESSKTEADLAPKIAALFDVSFGPDPITEKQLGVPDAVFPWAFGNQIGSLDNMATFFDDLMESMAALPERAAKGAASIVGSSPWILGLAAVAVAALIYSRSTGGSRD